ncbi:hypothetical protein DB30_06794 [Enhygromyxa salina]|uniref:Uncharacterized protein n=1 Tax=Enhygromyxa salina TaxID=215803 RepID=A0A0C2CTG0_9BACT|nr:hypothetical protein [Enhygromyxa salina]KIG14451.1 hypothetical protein DB30_06794 [Enhygromyxa salina]
MDTLKQGWGALGSTVLAIACVPRVSASIVVEPPPKPPKAEGPATADVAKPKPRTRGDDPGPPQIVRAEQLSASQLRLHFSEAIAPLGEVDPNDFRVSVLSVYINPRAGYSYAYYYDFGYRSYGQMLRFTSAQAGTLELDLYFAPAVPQHYCRQLDYQNSYAPPGAHAETALFLHYAAGAIPILDTGGTALQNFGADWVVAGRGDAPESRREVPKSQAQRAGQGLVRIECGPAIPPGPR